MSEQREKMVTYWQRIAGALVLTGLVLLLLPVLLTEAPEAPMHYPDEVEAVQVEPLRLDAPEMHESEPIEVDDATRDYLLGEHEDSQEPAAEPEQPDAMQLEEDLGATAYAVRIGAFGDMDNIDKLLGELDEQGVKSYTRLLERDARLLHIIFAGPFATYTMAEDAQATIEANIVGIGAVRIVEYAP